MRVALVMVSVVAALLVLGGGGPRLAAAGNGDVQVPFGDPIQIAVVLDMSGPAADIGASSLNAIDMAIEDFGPIQGFDVQRNEFDGGCNQGFGANVAETVIANPQHVGVLGHLCSGSTTEAMPGYEEAKIVTISGTSTSNAAPNEGPTVFNRTIVGEPSDDWLDQVASLDSVQEWSAEYETRFGDPPTQFADLFYDAATLLLTRIDEVAVLNAAAPTATNVASVDTLTINRLALAAAVRDTTDFPGVTCLITLDDDGSRVNDPADLEEPCAGSAPVKGDADCDGDADSVDALKTLQHIAAIPFSQNDPCPGLDTSTASAQPAGAGGEVFGDINCNGGVDSVDALFILRHVAGLAVNLPDGCAPIGG